MKPPFSDKEIVFDIPVFESGTFKNGTEYYLINDTNQTITTINIIAPAGAYFDKHPGTAAFAAKLMQRSTKNYPASAINRKLENMGLNLSCSGLWDEVSFNLTGMPQFIESGLDILGDILINPMFEQKELDFLKAKTVSSIEQDLVNPSFLAQVAFNSSLYKSHPYGRSRIGSIENVGSISRDDCIDWHKNLLKSKMTVFIAGNFDKDRILAQMENILSNAANPDKVPTIHPVSYNFTDEPILVEKKEAPQVTIRYGFPTISRKDEHYPYLQLINTILGGYFLSRLNKIIREEKGYTYGLHSTIENRKAASAFYISSDINADKVKETLEEIDKQIDIIANNPIPQEELLQAQRYILGIFLRSTETPQQAASLIRTTKIYDLPIDHHKNLVTKISTATPEILLPLQAELFGNIKKTVVLCGDLERIKKQI